MKEDPKNKISTKVTLEDNSTLALPTFFFFKNKTLVITPATCVLRQPI